MIDGRNKLSCENSLTKKNWKKRLKKKHWEILMLCTWMSILLSLNLYIFIFLVFESVVFNQQYQSRIIYNRIWRKGKCVAATIFVFDKSSSI